jgi:hypothetical protein
MVLAKNNIILGNNQVLSGFSEDGILYNHKSIESRDYLEILQLLPTQRYEYDMEALGFDFEPVSVYCASLSNLTGNQQLNIDVVDKKTNITVFPLALTTQLNLMSSRVFKYEFSPIAISQKAKLVIYCNVALAQLLIYGEKRYINAYHKPTLVTPI